MADEITLKALVIEDDMVTMKVSTAYLKDLGFEVYQAEDVVSALGIMRDNKDIRVAFVNLYLDDFSGLAFVRALGREHSYRHLKMFMLTTETAKNAVRAAITDGACGYLLKPVTRRQYISCLCESGVLDDVAEPVGVEGEPGEDEASKEDKAETKD